MMNVQIENMVNQLNEIKTEENKQQVVNYLSDLFIEMGYNAIAGEIKYNRKAKDNALYGLKMYHSDLTGDRINPVTNEVFKVSQDKIDTVNKFCNMLKSIIDTYLDNGTDKQNEYLKIKGEYDNASYLFHEAMFKLDSYEPTSRRDEKYKELVKEFDYYSEYQKEAKNKLDQFVLNNLI